MSTSYKTTADGKTTVHREDPRTDAEIWHSLRNWIALRLTAIEAGFGSEPARMQVLATEYLLWLPDNQADYRELARRYPKEFTMQRLQHPHTALLICYPIEQALLITTQRLTPC